MNDSAVVPTLYPCEHRRLTWGCDPCRRQVETDQWLDEITSRPDGAEAELLDGLDHIAFEMGSAAGSADRIRRIVDMLPWMPMRTLTDLAARDLEVEMPVLLDLAIEIEIRRRQAESVGPNAITQRGAAT